IKMTQAFKENDTKEQKVFNAFFPILNLIDADKDSFHEQAYLTEELEELLYDLKRSTLSDTIERDTFIRAFSAIHNLFKRPGTFEFYLDVFRLIWGEDVEVEFTQEPGKLLIDVTALSKVN